MHEDQGSARPLVLSAVVAFAAFGAFWGAWGASIPRIRSQAGLDDSELGVALLFVAAGALPAMLVTGKAIDRWGLRLGAVAIAALGGLGVLAALVGHDLRSLAVALTLVGVASGAADVAINTVAGRAQREAGRPVITRAHAVFSTFVVIASLGTGLLTALGTPVVAPFAGVALVAAVAAAQMARSLPARPPVYGTPLRAREPAAPRPIALEAEHAMQPRPHVAPTMSLIGFGLLGALAFASENAHQSWSAVFVTDALGTDVALGSLAPAIFAAGVAVTRFATGGIGVTHARVVLATGSATAAAGALVLAVAPGLALGVVGLVLAAAGTAVLFPTILGVVGTRVEESRRGRATSTVTTMAYLGFLLGPVYVGFWSDAVGIRGAMVAVAALGMALLLLTRRVQPSPERVRQSVSW